MANPLFARILPKEAAASGQLVECKGEVGGFARLAEIVEADIGAQTLAGELQNWQAAPVAIRLEFAWADGIKGIPAVSGRAAAELPAVCQRCLEAFELSLDAPINMIIATPAEAAELETHEVWELEGEVFRLIDLVEEALVMAMPLAPTHKAGESCAALTVENRDSGSETARPFADLRSQMENSNN